MYKYTQRELDNTIQTHFLWSEHDQCFWFGLNPNIHKSRKRIWSFPSKERKTFFNGLPHKWTVRSKRGGSFRTDSLWPNGPRGLKGTWIFGERKMNVERANVDRIMALVAWRAHKSRIHRPFMNETEKVKFMAGRKSSTNQSSWKRENFYNKRRDTSARAQFVSCDRDSRIWIFAYINWED